MPKFNRERAKSELGWSDEQINAYLASPQARSDSAGAVAPPAAPDQATGSDPLGQAAGMASGALDAIGGPRTLLVAGGLGGAGAIAKRMMSPAPAPAAAPTAPAAPASAATTSAPGSVASRLPANRILVTQEMIDRHPEGLANYQPGDDIGRTDLDKIRRPTGSVANRSAPKAPTMTATTAVEQPSSVASFTPAAADASEPAVSKAATEYWRKRAFAMMNEAGMPNDAASISKALGRDIKSRSTLTPDDWMAVHDAAGDKLSQDAAEAAAKRASAKAGKMPTRPIKVIKGGKALDANAPAPEPGYTGGRGASGPTLERRATALKAVKGTGSVQSRVMASEAPSELEQQLAQSLEAQQAMKAAGLGTAEQSAVRSGLRGALGSANVPLQVLLMLLGAQHTGQDIDAAHEQLTPEPIRRALMQARQPQGS